MKLNPISASPELKLKAWLSYMGHQHTALKNEVKRLLLAQGPSVEILDLSSRSGVDRNLKDWPDLYATGLLQTAKGAMWVEIKVKPDKPSQGQLDKIERLRAAGDVVVVAYRVEDVMKALGTN